MQCRIACEVQCESRFTNCGTCSENDKVGILPPIRYTVQPGESTWYAGKIVIPAPQVFDTLNRLHQYAIDGIEIFTQVIIGDLEELAFCVIQQVEYIRAVFIRVTDDLAADAYQFTLNEFLKYDTGVRFNVGGGDYRIGKAGDIIRSTYHF